MKLAAALLAAGRSVRFGPEDKLARPLDGIPLGHHAARVLAALPIDIRIVVTGADTIDWPGFRRTINTRPQDGMAGSIRRAVRAAREAGADALLIALADMPFVTVAHLSAVLQRHRGPDTLVASVNGAQPMPPALFGRGWFDALEKLDGDEGARAIIARADIVRADPSILVDIDRPEDWPDDQRPWTC